MSDQKAEGKRSPAKRAVLGLVSRRLAIEALGDVLVKHKPLDGALDRVAGLPAAKGLHPSDLALTRLIALSHAFDRNFGEGDASLRAVAEGSYLVVLVTTAIRR